MQTDIITFLAALDMSVNPQVHVDRGRGCLIVSTGMLQRVTEKNSSYHFYHHIMLRDFDHDLLVKCIALDSELDVQLEQVFCKFR